MWHAARSCFSFDGGGRAGRTQPMPDMALRQGVVAIYAMVALLALNAARRGRGRERTAWLLTAAILVLLGTAKLFQVQEAVTDAARNGLATTGWYADHREVQAAAAAV